MKDITKKDDAYSVKSADFLKTLVNKEIKNVFSKALRCIEMRFGNEFEGFQAIRAEILRAGNDAIRETERIIDERFNVESVPSFITVKFNKDGQGK